jgi:cytochrome c oxidase subunit 4
MSDPHDSHEPHVVPVRIYVAVFLALMVLTAATVWAAGQDFGPMNTIVALAIAVTKATLVVLFFMHVKYGTPLIRLAVVAAIVWLGLLLVITMSDYRARGWLGTKTRPYQIQDN